MTATPSSPPPPPPTDTPTAQASSSSSPSQSQTQTQPSSILLRNRENQRASRARRKGYIESLESRVRGYERASATATVEVQAAARKVAEENFWLRQLLARRGVAGGEVDEWVDRNRGAGGSAGQQSVQQRGGGEVSAPPAAKRRKGSEMSARELEAARTLGLIDSTLVHHRAVMGAEVQSPTAVAMMGRGDLPPTPEDSYASEQELAANHNSNSSTSPELRGMSSSSADQQERRYHRPLAATTSIYSEVQGHRQRKQQMYSHDGSLQHPRQMDVTPCEEAAQIIASMRGHEDADAVWPELGCSADARCTVKNMTIFQLGDAQRR